MSSLVPILRLCSNEEKKSNSFLRYSGSGFCFDAAYTEFISQRISFFPDTIMRNEATKHVGSENFLN